MASEIIRREFDCVYFKKNGACSHPSGSGKGLPWEKCLAAGRPYTACSVRIRKNQINPTK